MKILLIGLAALGILVGGSYYGLAAAGPDAIEVERSVHVDAGPGALLPLVHDLEAWQQWTTWTQGEEAPDVQVREASAESGARWEWQDNGRECWLEFTAANEDGVEFDVQFGDFPMCHGYVLVVPSEEGGSSVTWTMTSDFSDSTMARVFGFFIDFDSAIGTDFEKGLDNLKMLAETNGTNPVDTAPTATVAGSDQG